LGAPEKACQNALPRRCMSVWEAIVASAACCGVGICANAAAGALEWCCLPLRREENGGGVADAERTDCADVK